MPRAIAVLATVVVAASAHPVAAASVVAHRPPGALDGPVAAHVLHVQGTAELSDATGVRSPATPGLGLRADDTLVVGRGAWALVVLANDHVVRLDDLVHLRVDEIVVGRAKRAARDVEDQLHALLPADELALVSPRELQERVEGWRKRTTKKKKPAPARPASGGSRGAAALADVVAARATPTDVFASPAFTKCILDNVRDLGLRDLNTVAVRVDVKGGRAVAVRSMDGVPIPPCARALLAPAAGGDDGWHDAHFIVP